MRYSNPSFDRRYAVFLIIVLLGAAIYSNILSSPFVFDDIDVIINNPRIKSLANFLDFSSSRYFTDLTFALNYAFGGLNPAGYHVVNIIIHIANSILVYLLVEITFKTPMMEGTDKDGLSGFVPASASLIFLVHPVQTQAVTYISQRYASLAAFFYLLSILLYVKAGLYGTHRWRKWVFYAAGLVFTFIAQKTKEISFTLPFMIALYEFTFFNPRGGRTNRLIRLAPFFLALLVIPFERLGVSSSAAGGLGTGIEGGTLGMMMREELSTLPRYDYLLTEFRVLVTYLRLLALPIGQNLDYDYPEFHTFFSPQVFLSALFLATAFLSAMYFYLKALKKRNALMLLASLGVLWFFIAVSVESSIIPISDVIFEHRLYLPSAGAFMAVSAAACLGAKALKLKNPEKTLLAALAALVLANSLVSYRRNLVWQNGLTLWQDVVAKSPAKARGYSNIGYILATSGKHEEAIDYFEKSLRLKPNLWIAYNNMGIALMQAGRYNEAVRYLKKVIEFKPDNWAAYNNIGDSLVRLDRTDEAVEYFEKCIKINPRFADAYSNIGVALGQAGKPAEAVRYFNEALKLNPFSADVHNNLGNAKYMLGRLDEAVEHYRKALSIDPGHSNARVNLESAAIRLKAGAGGASEIRVDSR